MLVKLGLYLVGFSHILIHFYFVDFALDLIDILLLSHLSSLELFDFIFKTLNFDFNIISLLLNVQGTFILIFREVYTTLITIILVS